MTFCSPILRELDRKPLFHSAGYIICASLFSTEYDIGVYLKLMSRYLHIALETSITFKIMFRHCVCQEYIFHF